MTRFETLDAGMDLPLETTTDEKHFPFETCFPGGTLVHTDVGLVPIEQIKIGDLVLSQPEMTGAIEYKPVLRTFSHQDETILAFSYVVDGEGGHSFMLYPTGNHPFWVVDEGWRRADLLGSGARLLLSDSSTAIVLSCVPVYRTSEQGVGWYQKSEFNDHVGFERNFGDGPAVVRAAAQRDDDIYFSDDPRLRLTVYNLEVADNHTYYVGSAGVWVHNGDRSLSMRNGERSEVAKGVPVNADATDWQATQRDRIKGRNRPATVVRDSPVPGWVAKCGSSPRPGHFGDSALDFLPL